MTNAEEGLIRAYCARAAELWAADNEREAERWFDAAVKMIQNAGGVFFDQEVDR
jgi:hypothetical protein